MAPLLYYSLLSLSFLLIVKVLLHLQSRRLRNLPPGPPTVPVIGNLHHLKHPLHRTFTALSAKYGEIVSLWFGSRLVVVVSSPSLVQECFNRNDVVLANRPKFLTGKYVFYNYTTLGSAPYGDHWRNLRRITTIDVLSNHRLNSFVGIRSDETMRFVQKLRNDAVSANNGSAKVELRARLTEMTFNEMMMMISGKRYYGNDGDVTDVEEARQFREIITEILSLLGANNKGDFLPLLRLFDFDNLVKRLKRIGKRSDAFLQGLIEQQRGGGDRDTMIDHLLKLKESQPEYYSDQTIKGLILVINTTQTLLHFHTFSFFYLYLSLALFFFSLSINDHKSNDYETLITKKNIISVQKCLPINGVNIIRTSLDKFLYKYF